jgi:hypothetical protein
MAKASTQSKATKTNETSAKKEVVATPVVEVAPVTSKKSKKTAEPVVEAVAPVVEAAAPVTSKKSKKAAEPVVVHVPEPVTAAPAKKSKKTVEPVVEAVAPVATKKGGAKKAVEPVAEPVKATKKGGAKKAGKKAAKKEAKEEQEGQRVVGHRFFRCVYKTTDDQIVHVGRYSGNKPKQAACKALTGIVKNNGLETGEKVTFLIQECTRGSKKKKYSYVGCQVDLPEPVRITITKKDGSSSQIEYTKNNDVKKISLSECGDLLNVDLEEDNEVEEAKVARVEKKVKTTKTAAKEAAAPAPVAPAKSAKASKAKKTH